MRRKSLAGCTLIVTLVSFRFLGGCSFGPSAYTGPFPQPPPAEAGDDGSGDDSAGGDDGSGGEGSAGEGGGGEASTEGGSASEGGSSEGGSGADAGGGGGAKDAKAD
jgi:hypothetical protein